MDIRTPLLIIVAGAFVVLPYVLVEFQLYQICLIAVTALIALGITMVTGMAGQVSLAQAAFVGLGGYGAAILATRWGVPMLLGIPLAAMASAAAGYFLGLATLRVSGHYLALATLAVTAIVQLAFIHLDDVTGGAAGMPVPPVSIAGVEFSSGTDLYYLLVPVVVLAFILVDNLGRSRYGRAFDALRQSDIAASSVGVDLLQYKAAAFAASAFLGALGGGMLAVLTTYLDPLQFGITQSIYYVAVAVVGGLRSPLGAIVGALVFVLLPEFLQPFQVYLGVIFGVLLLAFIVLLPEGLTGLLRLRWKRG